jgi:hypothetical protein
MRKMANFTSSSCLFLVIFYFVSTFCSTQSASAATATTLSSTSAAANVITLNEQSLTTVRLKSVLSLRSSRNGESPSPLELIKKQQKIYWSFKRSFAVPSWTNNNESSSIRTLNEQSPTELMISLDTEVQDNLKFKYSIAFDESEAATATTSLDENSFDLIITNLTYADAGLYKCNLWNQKTIYYRLVVSSK